MLTHGISRDHVRCTKDKKSMYFKRENLHDRKHEKLLDVRSFLKMRRERFVTPWCHSRVIFNISDNISPTKKMPRQGGKCPFAEQGDFDRIGVMFKRVPSSRKCTSPVTSHDVTFIDMSLPPISRASGFPFLRATRAFFCEGTQRGFSETSTNP